MWSAVWTLILIMATAVNEAVTVFSTCVGEVDNVHCYVCHIQYVLFDVSQALEQMAKYKADSAGGDNFNEGRYLRTLHPMSSLAELTIPLLQNIEKQLKTDLQIVREVCYLFIQRVWVRHFWPRTIVKHGSCYQNVCRSLGHACNSRLNCSRYQNHLTPYNRVMCLASWGHILQLWVQGFTPVKFKEKYPLVNSINLTKLHDTLETVRDTM